jgi:thioredoxin reductase (NADPH)
LESNWWVWAVYGAPLVLFLATYLRRNRKREATDASTLREAIEAGLTEPASLHPVIDPNLCIGSGSCAVVCPEKALGIIGGKAQLINASACIGHGACAAACPMQAITLVFGTARRGIDLPAVKPNFETHVDGIYIAGELGGMGLIRKAVEQGKQCLADIAKRVKASGGSKPGVVDVFIVGAGPAGIASSLSAKAHGLSSITIEQEETLGGSILHYPRKKLTMTAPMDLPLAGKSKFVEITKEKILDFWLGIVSKLQLSIQFGEQLKKIEKTQTGFNVTTCQRVYEATYVVLALGRRGTPRKLGVPGEDHQKVVYRLLEPMQYKEQHVMIVGGGDSAVEAAVSLASDAVGATVSLSYRGDAFNRIKPKNRKRLDAYVANGQIELLLGSKVISIGDNYLTIDAAGQRRTMQNEALIVCAGGELPTDLLRSMGIMIETHHGEKVA